MCNGIKIDARADILADVRADAQKRDGSMKPPECKNTTNTRRIRDNAPKMPTTAPVRRHGRYFSR